MTYVYSMYIFNTIVCIAVVECVSRMTTRHQVNFCKIMHTSVFVPTSSIGGGGGIQIK